MSRMLRAWGLLPAAVRGYIAQKAEEYRQELKEGKEGLPFSKIVSCNIGGPPYCQGVHGCYKLPSPPSGTCLTPGGTLNTGRPTLQAAPCPRCLALRAPSCPGQALYQLLHSFQPQ